MHLQENLTLSSGQVAQYPLDHVAYPGTKFETATSNGLGDTFTGNVTDRQMDARTYGQAGRLWYEINIPFF